MKSKQDIHLAIAALTMLTFKARNNEDKRLARKVVSALCWVMDYPTDFDKFIDSVKEKNLFGDLTPEKLDEIIKDSVEAVNEHEDEGHSE